MQLSGMDYEEYQACQFKIKQVNDAYDEARQVERDENAKKEDRKRAKEVADSIAKAAPAITKSVIGAIKAVHDSVLAYAGTLMRESVALQAVLAEPVRNHKDYLAFAVGLKQAIITLGDNSPNDSVGSSRRGRCWSIWRRRRTRTWLCG